MVDLTTISIKKDDLTLFHKARMEYSIKEYKVSSQEFFTLVLNYWRGKK